MPEYGFSLTHIFPYEGRIVDFVHIRKYTCQRKLAFRRIFHIKFYTFLGH